MGSLTDPENKLVYQMHQYLDVSTLDPISRCPVESQLIFFSRLMVLVHRLTASRLPLALSVLLQPQTGSVPTRRLGSLENLLVV